MVSCTIITIAHAPPGVRVHHQVEVGPDGVAHPADGFQVLLGPDAGAHFVGPKSELGNGVGFFGIFLGRHIHAGAAVQPNAIAHAAAEQFGNRNALGLADQIVECDFHGAI